MKRLLSATRKPITSFARFRLFFADGEGDEAVAILKEYLEKNPQETGFRMLLARVYIALNQYAEAAEQYRIIHRQDPGETGSLMLLSELYLNQGNLAEAETALQEVLAVNPIPIPPASCWPDLFERQTI
jgi:cytochrome c-type biogenesis protein CcmH/NrfG